MKRVGSFLLAALAAFAPDASADTTCTSTAIATQTPNWVQVANVPRFDASLGVLNGITLTVTGEVSGLARVEHFDSVPAVITTVFGATLTLQRPDTSAVVSVLPQALFVDNLSAYDGTLDFAGTSGATHVVPITSATSVVTLNSAADLALFTGVGALMLPVSGQNTCYSTGAGPVISQFQIQAGAPLVSVCYDYTPVGSAFCVGDGSGTGCPCGNASTVLAQEGCLNSLGLGAKLIATGTARVSQDTLSLRGSRMPDGPVLYAQGSLTANGGAGIAFGDGLLCIGGSTLRLGVKFNVNGQSALGFSAGDVPLSQLGGIPTAGGTFHYQGWYRDGDSNYCSSATFDWTQGLSVPWSG